MAIEVSVAQIKAAIKAIRSSFAKEAFPKLSQNLEEVSVAFGFPTWDALSGAAKASGGNENSLLAESPAEGVSLPAGSAVDIYVQCYTQFDDEDAQIPDWCRLTVDAALLKQLRRLHTVVTEATLSEAREYFYGFELRGESQSVGSELVVGGSSKRSGWFKVVTQVTRNSIAIESASLDIQSLMEHVQTWIRENRTYPIVLAGDHMAREVIAEGLREEGLLSDDIGDEVFPLV